MRYLLTAALCIGAAPATAQEAAPVAIPEGFAPFGGYVEEAEALYAFRRGVPEVDEQSIVIFRMRNRQLDAQLIGQVRDMLAVECTEATPQFVDMAGLYRVACPDGYVAYGRVFEGAQGVCIIALGFQWDGLDTHELALRQWIDGLEACAPESAWTAS